jgi:tetratricopeptide (TPR) repeat protein
VRFQAAPQKAETLWLYFGNPAAEPIAPLRQPDGSPWRPQRGLVLRIYAKPKPVFPDTLPQLLDLANHGTLQGALVRDQVSDGFNPCGTSSNYIGIYEGYLHIDKPGTYGFCSASCDGSWIVVNGKTILSWPGPHGYAGSEHGQKHGQIDLPPGDAFVQYFHEAGSHGHLAFLGWHPPGAAGYVAIPREQWLAGRTAEPAAYEARDKPLLAVPHVATENTYWVRDSADQQTTLVNFSVAGASRDGKITKAHWVFGDGLTAEGPSVQHVYFRFGRPEAALTVTDDHGHTDTTTFHPNIFLIDTEVSDVGIGNAEQHMHLAADYDTARLERDDLAEFCRFWSKLEHYKQAIAAAGAYLQRFPDGPAAGELAGLAADAAVHSQAYDPARAEQFYAEALTRTTGAQPKLHLQLRRARNLAWGLNDPKRAGPLFQAVSAGAPGLGDAEAAKLLTRSALIGLGDCALLTADLAGAKALYAKAQAILLRHTDDQEAQDLAKLGSYPFIIDDLRARGEYAFALQAIDQWENEFPLEKLDGLSFFWRGKVLYIWHPGDQAIRFLQLAELVRPAATHVPEAVWLQANCYLETGHYAQALEQFQRITTQFTTSEYCARVPEKVRQCQAALAAEAHKGGNHGNPK